MYSGIKLFASATALVGLLCAGAAPARADFSISINTPFVRFADPPPLVEVEPGIQVVQGFNEEVFYVDGYYWVRRHGRWYRSSQWDGSWSYVAPTYLPQFIVSAPRGYYRNWHRPTNYEYGSGHYYGHRYRNNPRYVAPAQPRYAPAPRVVQPPAPRYVAPAPRVNIQAPAPHVYTPAPRVNVQAPRVNIQAPAPRVNIQAPAPRVNVQPAPAPFQRRAPVPNAPSAPGPGRHVGPPGGGHGR